jgi:hypothetical protein
MVHDKGGLGGSICMYSVISKTTVLFLREVRALGIFVLSVAPRHHTKKCAIFSCANIFKTIVEFFTCEYFLLLLVVYSNSVLPTTPRRFERMLAIDSQSSG